MTALSLTEALEDSAALHDVAKRAGVTVVQARALLAALADLPAQQVVRMCGTAARDRLRRVNRATRLGRRVRST